MRAANSRPYRGAGEQSEPGGCSDKQFYQTTIQLQTCHNPQAALRASSPLKRGHEVVTCRGGYQPPVRVPSTTAGTDNALPGEQLPWVPTKGIRIAASLRSSQSTRIFECTTVNEKVLYCNYGTSSMSYGLRDRLAIWNNSCPEPQVVQSRKA